MKKGFFISFGAIFFIGTVILFVSYWASLPVIYVSNGTQECYVERYIDKEIKRYECTEEDRKDPSRIWIK